MVGSVAEWAKRHGISRQAAYKRIREHGIPQLSGGKIDFDAADARFAASVNPLQQQRGTKHREVVPPKPPAVVPAADPSRLNRDELAACLAISKALGVSMLAAAQLRAQLVKIEDGNLDLAEKRGTLIDRESVERSAFDRARAERDAWLNWPARIAPMLAAELGINERTLYAALQRELRSELDSRSSQESLPKVA